MLLETWKPRQILHRTQKTKDSQPAADSDSTARLANQPSSCSYSQGRCCFQDAIDKSKTKTSFNYYALPSPFFSFPISLFQKKKTCICLGYSHLNRLLAGVNENFADKLVSL